MKSDVDQELEVHLEMRAEELQSRGLSAEEARREAQRQFGDLSYTRRYCSEQDLRKEKQVHRALTFDDWRQDVRLCIRGLLRAPILTATIVATVGLGIGATTVIFSAVNAAILRPLPYPDPDGLVRIYTDAPPNRFRFSVADYLALEAQQTHFERVAAYTDQPMAFSDGTTAERLRGREVTWTYFGVLGLRPAIGRDFTERDAVPGAPSAAIVSHGMWQRRLGGRPEALGGTIRLDGRQYTVVGVLPAAVGPLEQRQEFFVAAQWETPRRRGPFFWTVVGRLESGVNRTAAEAELRAINRRIFPLWQASYQDDRATWSLMDLKAHIVGDVNTIAGVALVAVALVWLIACANASNLLIARVTSRRRELAIRTALGASRGRVVRYLLVESGALALGATALGIALAWLGIGVLREWGFNYFPRTQEIAIDRTAWSLLAALTAFSALLFGLIPAVHGTGGPIDESLRSVGRSATASLSARRLRRALVGSQFAIATPLLIVAGLLLASLTELERVDLGFDSHNVLTGSISLPAAQYAEPGRVGAFWDELQHRAEAIPAVVDVAFADGLAPNNVGNFNNFELEESPTPPGRSQPVTPWVSVTPAYFRLLGLSLIEGRVFDEDDRQRPDLEVVVVDRAWTKRFFPGRSALGKRFKEGGCTACPWTTVIGVVSDVKYAGLDRPDDGTVYTPMPVAAPNRYLIVRAGMNPHALIPAIREIVRDLDPGLPVTDTATVDELIAQSMETPRTLSLLVGAFATIALLLSVVGVYGVMTYYVQQHVKDISIRLALGGSPEGILRLVIGQGMKVVMSGVVIGLLAAVLLTQWMAGLLFGVGTTDPFTYVATSMLLWIVALVACFLPARRAAYVQPAAVLRTD